MTSVKPGGGGRSWLHGTPAPQGVTGTPEEPPRPWQHQLRVGGKNPQCPWGNWDTPPRCPPTTGLGGIWDAAIKRGTRGPLRQHPPVPQFPQAQHQSSQAHAAPGGGGESQNWGGRGVTPKHHNQSFGGGPYPLLPVLHMHPKIPGGAKRLRRGGTHTTAKETPNPPASHARGRGVPGVRPTPHTHTPPPSSTHRHPSHPGAPEGGGGGGNVLG